MSAGSDYAYLKRWRYERSHGITRTIDAEPARLHLASLMGHGMSLRSIAAAAGVAATTLSKVSTGQRSVKRLTANAILAVEPHVAAKASKQTTEPFVPKVGAVRRIQALLALGWTHDGMQRASGIRTGCVIHQQGRWVTRSTHDKVAAMYRDLSTRQGPSSRTRTRAAKLGYLGPLSWDDIDLDYEPETSDEACGYTGCSNVVAMAGLCQGHWFSDYHGTTPNVKPDDVGLDEVAIYRRIHGDKTVRLTKAEQAEVVDRMQRSGVAWNEIEARTGINVQRVRKAA